MPPNAPANIGREGILKWSRGFLAPLRIRFARFLIKVNIPVEAGNAAVKAGKLGATIQSILASLKPEAVYFTDDNGQKTAFIFLEMQDASQIPSIVEPWFLALNASIAIHPVMVPDDLGKAGSAFEEAVNKYG